MSEKDNNQCSLSEVCIKSITGPLWRAHYNSKKTIETIKEDFKNLSNNIHLTNTKLWGEYGNLKKTIETIQKDFENLNNELKPDNIDSNISSADQCLFNQKDVRLLLYSLFILNFSIK